MLPIAALRKQVETSLIGPIYRTAVKQPICRFLLLFKVPLPITFILLAAIVFIYNIYKKYACTNGISKTYCCHMNSWARLRFCMISEMIYLICAYQSYTVTNVLPFLYIQIA